MTSNINTEALTAAIAQAVTQAVVAALSPQQPSVAATPTPAAKQAATPAAKQPNEFMVRRAANRAQNAEIVAFADEHGILKAGTPWLEMKAGNRDVDHLLALSEQERRVVAGERSERKGKGKGKAQLTLVPPVQEPVKTPAKAKARPVGADAPRRADGTVTPKREWALREHLAETGQYDRFEIDAKVAEAMAVLDA